LRTIAAGGGSVYEMKGSQELGLQGLMIIIEIYLAVISELTGKRKICKGSLVGKLAGGIVGCRSSRFRCAGKGCCRTMKLF